MQRCKPIKPVVANFVDPGAFNLRGTPTMNMMRNRLSGKRENSNFGLLPEMMERHLASIRAARVSPEDAACRNNALSQGWGVSSGCSCGALDSSGARVKATWMHLVFDCTHEEVMSLRDDYISGLHTCLECVDSTAGESWIEVRRLTFAFTRCTLISTRFGRNEFDRPK